jgi:chromosomal replication initiator protein
MEGVNNQQLWTQTLVQIELQVSKANFNTWFKDTFIIKVEDNCVYLGVPNPFVRDWLLNKYHKMILKILRDLSENIRGVEYQIAKNTNKKVEEEAPIQKKHEDINATTLPLNEHYINKEDGLNPKYTFDNFIIGPFNENAYAASQAVLKNPGHSYNPLFIHGNTGFGKTHLIQAIGNYLKKAFIDIKVHYTTSERFSSDYIASTQGARINQFKEKYRKYDVLIMDDIQFLSKKEATQNELFHLFNILHENNKQIIFSSDMHPNLIPDVAERLKSRFNQGIIIDIQAPDHESRAQIIKAKARSLNVVLSEEIITYLADVVEGNIREIEGAVNTLLCQSQMKNRDLTILDIKNLIKTTSRPKKLASIKEVIKTIADFYNIQEEDMLNKNRRKEVVRPRQITMYILREVFNVSYPTIGEKMGGKDHTTIMYSCEKIKTAMKIDSSLSQEVSQLIGLLRV